MGPVKDPKKTGNSLPSLRTQSAGKLTTNTANTQPTTTNNTAQIVNEKANTVKIITARKSIANINVTPKIATIAQAVAGKSPDPHKGPAGNKGTLAVPVSGKGKPSERKSPTTQNLLTVRTGGSTAVSRTSSIGSGGTVAGSKKSANSSGGSSAGSQYSDDKRGRKQKGKATKVKRDNIFTRIKYEIAENDAMIERTGDYPHVSCIRITLILIPIFLLALVWDTMALIVFQIPRYSMIDHPCFVLIFQSTCILMSIYGYCIQSVENNKHRNIAKAIISIVCHILLFIWRVFYELEMDGYRYQEKSYLPKSRF